MDFFKKGFLLLVCIFCAVLLISPVDFIPFAHIDDVLYVIGAIASFAGALSMKKKDVVEYTDIDQ